MMDGVFEVPLPENEPVKGYAPGSPERAELHVALASIASEQLEVPVVIDGKPFRTGRLTEVAMPHDHAHVLATVHHATAADVNAAIEGALRVAPAWQALPFEERAAVFLRAADLLAGPWRMRINAACMLGQSKTCHQAEIDAACELIDFFRFNVAFARQIQAIQPRSVPGQWNRTDYRPLEGFVLAVTPFNFLSIAVNLAAAPALLGNVVLWKPSHTSMVGVWHCLQLLREAGLPDGVIQLIGGDGPEQGRAALASEHLAGIHFTGSTGTFRALYQGVASNLEHYRSLPRVVGETGGKDFIMAHASADADALATAIVRGGYEYQGQKCSAASRVYVPRSLWPAVSERVCAQIAELKIGDVTDYRNFLGAVIDERAFGRITGYQALAKESAKVLAGGGHDRSKGWFVEPTFVEVADPKHRLMQEEIFGPIVSAFVYEDAAWSDTLTLVDTTSPYGLTGAVFATDRAAVREAQDRLRQAAGNFYVNDKPTGAVVGQQPFGGARASGTNDKAGSLWNLGRWLSPRSIKETFVPARDWRYPFVG
ncbi:MAG: L-glutamate gamma-semialdehyde dehydrogenase [Myxococcales bacterium]|nr:L-glutamate gamma-semialdehyde dehydrogenase [Myxococcales bacterium]